jgi:hypothetical protein
MESIVLMMEYLKVTFKMIILMDKEILCLMMEKFMKEIF